MAQQGEWRLAGSRLVCPTCYGTVFTREEAASPIRRGFLGLGGQRAAATFSCTECGYVLWWSLR